ncbi:MAG: outer membrane beta-barrel protein [Magnetococcales bacterium]|nr:outer membrane beta-barrel protein [Magnetococcales bacterium]
MVKSHKKSLLINSALSAFLIAGALTISTPKTAEAGVTLSLKGGVVMFENGGAGDGLDFELDYEAGYAAAIAIGYDLPMLPIKVEVEYLYQSAKIDEISNPPAGFTALSTFSGDATVNALMANAYVNLPIPLLKPYIGLGVGGANVNYSSISTDSMQLFDESSTHFAYQGMVGILFSVPVLPLELMAEYRYFATTDAESTADVVNTNFDIPFASHLALLGARVEF